MGAVNPEKVVDYAICGFGYRKRRHSGNHTARWGNVPGTALGAPVRHYLNANPRAASDSESDSDSHWAIDSDDL